VTRSTVRVQRTLTNGGHVVGAVPFDQETGGVHRDRPPPAVHDPGPPPAAHPQPDLRLERGRPPQPPRHQRDHQTGQDAERQSRVDQVPAEQAGGADQNRGQG
jgi:hypothetical protein